MYHQPCVLVKERYATISLDIVKNILFHSPPTKLLLTYSFDTKLNSRITLVSEKTDHKEMPH